MKKLFEIGIGFDEESQTYVAVLVSMSDNKRTHASDRRLRSLMSKVTHLVRGKAFKDQSFPIFPADFARQVVELAVD